MNFKVITIAMAIVLSYVMKTHAQDCHQSVVIMAIDDATKEAVIGAAVGINEVQGVTNYLGIATIDNICIGKIHLHIIAMGYVPIDTDTMITAGDTLHFALTTQHQSLDEIEVVGHHSSINTNKATAVIAIEKIQSASGATLGAILTNVSGMDQLKTGVGISKPMLNGMHSNRLLILNNGIRQEGQQWGAEHAPEIDPNMAQNIEVIKGAESIRYGADAIGGVVLINPPTLHQSEPLAGYISTQLQSNGRGGSIIGQVSGSLKKYPKLGFRAQATAKQLGNFKTAEYYLDNTGVKELSFNTNISYVDDHSELSVYYSRFYTQLGILSSAHLGNIDELQHTLQQGRPITDGAFSYTIAAPRQQATHDLVKVALHKHLNDYNHLNVQYGLQRNVRKEYDKRRGGRTSIPSLDIVINSNTLDAYWDYYNGKNIKWQTGINYIHQFNESDPTTLTLPLIPDYSKDGIGLYSLLKYSKNKSSIEAGLRADAIVMNIAGYNNKLELFVDKKQFYNVTGSLNYAYYLSSAITLRASVGNAFRPPSVNELYSTGLHHGAAEMEYGNPDLNAENSYQALVELDYVSHHIQLNTSFFYNYFNNYIYLNPMHSFYQSLRGVFPEFEYKETQAIFYGWNMEAIYHITHQWQYELRPTVVLAKNLNTDSYLPFVPAPKLDHKITYATTINDKLQNVGVSISHLFVSEQKRFDIVTDYVAAPPSYNIFGLQLGADIKVGTTKWRTQINVDNVFNTLYKDYLNRYRYFAHDLGRNINLRIQYHF